MNQSSPITAEQWTQVQRLLDELDLLPAEQRAGALARRDIHDDRVRREVASLLDAEAARGDFMEQPPWAQAGPRPVEPALPPGTALGAFRVDQLIGRGGTAEVYRAHRAAEFDQCVAVKLISGEARTRLDAFQRERRILATLEHPGIARIVDGGITDAGRPYMVMEYVEGTDLIRHAQEHKLDLRGRLDLFRQVCEAVSFAHRHLVIHRDLKPGNIRVTPAGQVKLLDFGVAKLQQSGVRTSEFETATILTPEFAAPEQLYGEPVTTATDVYALGVVLFQLLSGAPAFRTEGRPMHLVIDELLRSNVPVPSETAAALADPPLPARALQGDLDAIVARATRKKPAERYATADELWADLARHLAHEPVQARRDSRGYRLRRLARRYRSWIVAGMAVAVLTVAAVQGTLWRAHIAIEAGEAASLNAARAERARRVLVQALAAVGAAGTATARSGDLAAERIIDALPDDPGLQAQLLLDLADIRAGQGQALAAAELARHAVAIFQASGAPPPLTEAASKALARHEAQAALVAACPPSAVDCEPVHAPAAKTAPAL